MTKDPLKHETYPTYHFQPGRSLLLTLLSVSLSRVLRLVSSFYRAIDWDLDMLDMTFLFSPLIRSVIFCLFILFYASLSVFFGPF